MIDLDFKLTFPKKEELKGHVSSDQHKNAASRYNSEEVDLNEIDLMANETLDG